MTIHTFTPTHYFNVLAVAPPVLTLAPGDTVQTTTVDAHGFDAARRQVTPPGNPMTGPFYVEGAEPGDALVVHIDAITPNRTYGWGNTMLAPNVVDPEFVRDLPWPPVGERRRSHWHVDVAAGTAILVDPVVPGGLTLPLAPMLGCFGVAPAGGEAISTATSGPQGGNMDYRGFIAGVTVYFPVFVPGALFSWVTDTPCRVRARSPARASRFRAMSSLRSIFRNGAGSTGRAARHPRTSSPPAMHGHLTRHCSTPPRRWRAGSKKSMA